MILGTLIVVGAALLAFANGANDVSRGIATLTGTGRASHRAAIAWGTVWTLAGGLASLVISIGLVNAFTSAIVGPDVLATPTFALAVALGAATWVLVASATGLPVSTTHALTGTIVGVASAAGGSGTVRWWMLLSAIAAPLAISPVVWPFIGYAMHAVAARLAPACVRDEISVGMASRTGSVMAVLTPQIVASPSGCSPADHTWRFMPAGTLHWSAAAALSFARGVNDNAKIAAIAALGMPAIAGGLWPAFLVTANRHGTA